MYQFRPNVEMSSDMEIQFRDIVISRKDTLTTKLHELDYERNHDRQNTERFSEGNSEDHV